MWRRRKNMKYKKEHNIKKKEHRFKVEKGEPGNTKRRKLDIR